MSAELLPRVRLTQHELGTMHFANSFASFHPLNLLSHEGNTTTTVSATEKRYLALQLSGLKSTLIAGPDRRNR